jgi:hypothetical protein
MLARSSVRRNHLLARVAPQQESRTLKHPALIPFGDRELMIDLCLQLEYGLNGCGGIQQQGQEGGEFL